MRYKAKLKTRAQLDRDIKPDHLGWWYNVAAGETLKVRDATQADLDRCVIHGDRTRDPKDYLVEDIERGWLVLRAAVAELTPRQSTGDK